MTNHLWTQFEDCALKIADLQDQLREAKAVGNLGLASTISHNIKELETIRDRLLCCLGEVAGAGSKPSSIVDLSRSGSRLAEAAD